MAEKEPEKKKTESISIGPKTDATKFSEAEKGWIKRAAAHIEEAEQKAKDKAAKDKADAEAEAQTTKSRKARQEAAAAK